MNKKFVVVVVLAMLVAATGFSVSGTYAKYTSSFTGTDDARVAKWAFTLGTDSNVVKNKTFNFDLFSHTNSHVNSDVIAPGTSGSTDGITLTNNSEVDAVYSIVYTITNPSKIPVKFTNGGTEVTLTDTETEGVSTFTVTDQKIARGDSATLSGLVWEWPFEGNDTVDTDLGVDGTAEIEVEAAITVTQDNSTDSSDVTE